MTSFENSAGALATLSVRSAGMQTQVAGPREVGKSSPGRLCTDQALRRRPEIVRQTAYDRSGSEAARRLSGLASALGRTVTLLRQAKELTRTALRTGTGNAELAEQLIRVRADVLAAANTADVAGRPIFAGITTRRAAFDSTGNYLGTATVASRVVAPGVSIAVTRDGSAIFGSGRSSVFQVLEEVATGVANGDVTGAQDALEKLGKALSRLSDAESVVGADADHLRTISPRSVRKASVPKVTTARQPSGPDDADLADQIFALSQATLSYDAALRATARTSQISLLDYLR